MNKPVPGDAYAYLNPRITPISVKLNGKEITFAMDRGYAVIDREWKKGDEISVQLPMTIERVISNENIHANKGLVALQRGPLVYCLEHADNNGKARNIIFPDLADFTPIFDPALLGGIITIRSKVPVVKVSGEGQSIATSLQEITAIPCYAWANRGEGEMEVWVPRKVTNITLLSK